MLARLARHLGAAQVIGTVGSEAKIPVARGFGYDHVVLRDQLHERLPEIAPDGIDVALDPVGGPAFAQGLEALRPLGRLVRYGNASGAEDEPLATLGLVYANRTIGASACADSPTPAPMPTGRCSARPSSSSRPA